jgi:hypothetical protein
MQPAYTRAGAHASRGWQQAYMQGERVLMQHATH